MQNASVITITLQRVSQRNPLRIHDKATGREVKKRNLIIVRNLTISDFANPIQYSILKLSLATTEKDMERNEIL